MRDGEQGGKKGEKVSMTGVRMRDGSAARKVSAHFSPPRCMGAMCVCVHVRMHACLHSRTHVFVWKETIDSVAAVAATAGELAGWEHVCP
jgi:hypothetical protein